MHRRTALLAATAGIAGVAGCTEILGDTLGSDDGSDTENESDDPSDEHRGPVPGEGNPLSVEVDGDDRDIERRRIDFVEKEFVAVTEEETDSYFDDQFEDEWIRTRTREETIGIPDRDPTVDVQITGTERERKEADPESYVSFDEFVSVVPEYVDVTITMDDEDDLEGTVRLYAMEVAVGGPLPAPKEDESDCVPWFDYE